MFRPPRRSVRIIGAAEDRDFLMHVRIGIMRALNRHVERVFDTSAKRSIGDRGSWREIDDGSPKSSHRVEHATPSGVMTATCHAATSTALSALPSHSSTCVGDRTDKLFRLGFNSGEQKPANALDHRGLGRSNGYI